MDTLEAYTRLVDAGVPVHIDPFSGSSGSLTDAAVDLLSLDQEQKDEVQSTIEAARLEIERLRKQSATTHIDESGQLSVTCPAFPERGDQIRNILLESLSSKLEDSQFELLQDISNDWKELDSSHSDFGQTNLTFTFKVQIVKEEVRIKAERHSDAANPPNRTWSYWPRFLNRNVAGGPKEYLDPESTRYLIEIAARMQTELDSSETTPRP